MGGKGSDEKGIDPLVVAKTIDFLVSRGYDEEKLINEYPISKVMLYAKASRENQKIERIEFATAITVGVAHAIDMAFGKGKGRILDKYIKVMTGDSIRRAIEEGTEDKDKKFMSDDAFNFFMGMPVN